MTAAVSSPLFSHPVAESPRPGALVRPQEDRYGGLFRQPGSPASPAGPAESQPISRRARHRR
ncbi:hypothetical protein CU254_15015 [Amycolatopsis sp. AA4]|nr:hypothetical protein CU254_15015 [Amycolatopsis sp. AA4]